MGVGEARAILQGHFAFRISIELISDFDTSSLGSAQLSLFHKTLDTRKNSYGFFCLYYGPFDLSGTDHNFNLKDCTVPPRNFNPTFKLQAKPKS
jgi:hypothetical protein